MIGKLKDRFVSFLITFILQILRRGPIPSHLSFIMDGNRRFAKKEKVETGLGHRAGSSSFVTMVKYCCDLGIKYLSVYGFSIDNCKRSSSEVEFITDLIAERFEEFCKDDSLPFQKGIRVYVIGNLKLVSKKLRVASEKVMRATANHNKHALFVFVAYTSRDEIRHAVEKCCRKKLRKFEMESDCGIKVEDIEKEMYMAIASDPDMMIRTSGETRLSNFLLWQTTNCALYSLDALWPQMGLWQLLCSILHYQQNHSYLENKRNNL